MIYDKNPSPDLEGMRSIINDHETMALHLVSSSDTPTLCKVKQDQYNVLLRDLNRKVEEVRTFQVKVEHEAAMNGHDLEERIKSLLQK